MKLNSLLAASALLASSLSAQNGPETVKGRILDDSAHAVVATIMVTRGPDRLTQQTTSDAQGNYSTRFEQGTGDYLVYVSAPGFIGDDKFVEINAASVRVNAPEEIGAGLQASATLHLGHTAPSALNVQICAASAVCTGTGS